MKQTKETKKLIKLCETNESYKYALEKGYIDIFHLHEGKYDENELIFIMKSIPYPY